MNKHSFMYQSWGESFFVQQQHLLIRMYEWTAKALVVHELPHHPIPIPPVCRLNTICTANQYWFTALRKTERKRNASFLSREASLFFSLSLVVSLCAKSAGRLSDYLFSNLIWDGKSVMYSRGASTVAAIYHSICSRFFQRSSLSVAHPPEHSQRER